MIFAAKGYQLSRRYFSSGVKTVGIVGAG